jgi:hypothetical protein
MTHSQNFGVCSLIFQKTKQSNMTTAFRLPVYDNTKRSTPFDDHAAKRRRTTEEDAGPLRFFNFDAINVVITDDPPVPHQPQMLDMAIPAPVMPSFKTVFGEWNNLQKACRITAEEDVEKHGKFLVLATGSPQHWPQALRTFSAGGVKLKNVIVQLDFENQPISLEQWESVIIFLMKREIRELHLQGPGLNWDVMLSSDLFPELLDQLDVLHLHRLAKGCKPLEINRLSYLKIFSCLDDPESPKDKRHLIEFTNASKMALEELHLDEHVDLVNNQSSPTEYIGVRYIYVIPMRNRPQELRHSLRPRFQFGLRSLVSANRRPIIYSPYRQHLPKITSWTNDAQTPLRRATVCDLKGESKNHIIDAEHPMCIECACVLTIDLFRTTCSDCGQDIHDSYECLNKHIARNHVEPPLYNKATVARVDQDVMLAKTSKQRSTNHLQSVLNEFLFSLSKSNNK